MFCDIFQINVFLKPFIGNWSHISNGYYPYMIESYPLHKFAFGFFGWLLSSVNNVNQEEKHCFCNALRNMFFLMNMKYLAIC